MIPLDLSPAALRTLILADQFQQRESGDSEGLHLFRALIASEARAGEFLKENRFDLRSLPASLKDCLTRSGTDIDPAGWMDRDNAGSGELHDILQEAARLALSTEGPGEIFTEHLLAACQRNCPEVAVQLLDHGVTAEQIEMLFKGSAAGAPGLIEIEPLELDRETSDLSEIKTPAPPAVGSTIPLSLLFRVLDASANRAREGLRVIEDCTRFLLDEQELTRQLKEIRHQIRQGTEQFPDRELMNARDTTGDVGTDIATTHEFSRTALSDVVMANFKRAQEALRSLEEFSKLNQPAAARIFEQCRYRLYELEKTVMPRVTEPFQTADFRCRKADSPLYLLLTLETCQRPWQEVLAGFQAAGGRIVQLREKGWTDRQLVELGKEVQVVCLNLDLVLIVNDRPDIAVAIGADGVHLGQDDQSPADARRLLGPEALIGRSTHSIRQVDEAIDERVDYLGVGPVFSSRTKSFDQFPGLEFVEAVAARGLSVPWYPIGGIHPGNLQELVNRGAMRAAISHAACSSADPEEVCRELIQRFPSAVPDAGLTGELDGRTTARF